MWTYIWGRMAPRSSTLVNCSFLAGETLPCTMLPKQAKQKYVGYYWLTQTSITTKYLSYSYGYRYDIDRSL